MRYRTIAAATLLASTLCACGDAVSPTATDSRRPTTPRHSAVAADTIVSVTSVPLSSPDGLKDPVLAEEPDGEVRRNPGMIGSGN